MTDGAITYILHKLYMQIWRNERILLGGGEWGCHKKLGAGYVLAVQDMSVAELQLQWKTCTHPAALHKKYKKKVPTLSHTTTRTTTIATTATSRKKKSNKNFYVMSLSLICGTCPTRLCIAQCTAQTTGAPRTSALNKTGDASCLKGDYRVRRGRERKEGLPLGWVWGTGLCTELLCLIWP